MERGRLLQQIEVIQKKFRKGKPLGQIAEEMEETVQVVEVIYRLVQEIHRSPVKQFWKNLWKTE